MKQPKQKLLAQYHPIHNIEIMNKICTGIFILLIISLSGIGQSREDAEIKAAVETLDKALIDTNKTVLESIVSDDLSYGHSNGKVENKQEFINGVFSSPIRFQKIDATDFDIKFYGKIAVVRHGFQAAVLNAGKPDIINLRVLQVWQKQKGKWMLLARQAVRMP
jgi:hypothetical protein